MPWLEDGGGGSVQKLPCSLAECNDRLGENLANFFINSY